MISYNKDKNVYRFALRGELLERVRERDKKQDGPKGLRKLEIC